MSIRLPAVIHDALRSQLPDEYKSVNAWAVATLAELVDVGRLKRHERLEWRITAEQQQRAGRR